MEFENVDALRSLGAKGFFTVHALHESACAEVPRVPGIYFIFRNDDSPPRFTQNSSGGNFKKRDTSFPVEELAGNWVEGAKLLYIGKAGGKDSKATLRSRLWQYLQFGYGKPVGHWDGRSIWQLADSRKLLVAWMAFDHEEPGHAQGDWISRFAAAYGKCPFANPIERDSVE